MTQSLIFFYIQVSVVFAILGGEYLSIHNNFPDWLVGILMLGHIVYSIVVWIKSERTIKDAENTEYALEQLRIWQQRYCQLAKECEEQENGGETNE